MNHSESLRRWVRTGLSGLLVTILCVYLCSPRLLVEAGPAWLPSHSTELNAFVDAGVERLASSQPTEVDSSDQTGGADVAQARISEASLFAWSVAGFPFDSVHVQTNGTEVRYHTSVSALVLNALAMIVIVGGVVGFVYFNDTKSRFRSQFLLAWGSVVCVFVAGAGWEIVRANQQTKSLKQYGHITQRESIRHPLFRMLPDSVRVAWAHCYSFRQNESFESLPGDHRLATYLADHPELHVVELSEDLSAAVSEELGQLPFLHTLAVRRLTSIEGLRSLTQDLPTLHSLQASMGADTGNADIVAPSRLMPLIDFRSMPKLQYLSLIGIDLSDFSSDAFSVASLQTLSIALKDGNSPTLSIRDQRSLKELNVASSRNELSSLAIELVNLPSLTSLGTPRFRPVDLKINQTPRLRNISANVVGEEVVSSNADDIPPWIRSLEIQDAASLTTLAATVDSPEHWIVKGCPNLRTLAIEHPSAQWQSLLSLSQRSHDLTVIWDWMKGPLPVNQISFDRVDLRSVDLSDWKEMKYLERISLERCITHTGQLRQLTKLPRLNQIMAPEIAVDSSTADELLASRNDWVELSVDWSGLDSIRIADQSKLVAAFGLTELRAKEIELKDLPRFRGSLSIHGGATRLKLDNLPLVPSVLINGTMPRDAKLEGLTSLRRFGVRGSRLSDEQLRCLRSSSQIQCLYLPRCNVPRELVTGLSKWRRLDTVDLSSLRVRVDHEGREESRLLCDDDTLDLPHLPSLTALNLDGSEIGIETLDRLTACQKLQAVSLRNCLLAGDQLLPLTVSNSLLELRVARSTVVPDELLDAVEVERGVQSGEAFVLNWITQATSQDVRRSPRGWKDSHDWNGSGRMPFAVANGEQSKSLIARQSSRQVESSRQIETGEAGVVRDSSSERPFPRRHMKRRVTNWNTNS